MSGFAILLLLAAPAQYDAPVVSDPTLAAARGGFQLPNGIDVAITVQTQTVVDGAVVLRTVFQANQGQPTLTVYAPKAGEVVAAPASSAGPTASATPVVTYDRQNGIQITPAATMPAISVGTGSPTAADAASGLTPVDATGGAVTDAGTITRTDRGGLDTVRLVAPDLNITHFAGNAFGSAVANSGSDRSIDTTTAVSINLSNAGPDVLGSAMLRIQDISADATRGRF